VALFERGVTAEAGAAAVRAAGGTVERTSAGVGYAVVRADAGFAERASRQQALVGAARNRIVGAAPSQERPARRKVERLARERADRTNADGSRRGGRARPAEPLADLQWNMEQIGATASASHRLEKGSRKVLVGIIDTGVDGSHPDVAPNFDAELSRNFTKDMPDIDNGEDADGDGVGDEPCEVEGCVDPADVDDDGHGTHVASVIGSPVNGLGVAGVAPNVTLVNIRAGQDSGYFFLQPTLDALTYAGDIGVDVVNLSYYVDPWLYNCTDNPGDSPAERIEQRTVREATQRAIDYARGSGVLPVSSMGNGATDLGKPTSDNTSPDYPADAARPRVIDNSCITVPTETSGVVAVTSTGPSERKAYYSDYGIEQADVAAPGGDVYDTPNRRRSLAAAILAAYPAALAVKNGDVDETGEPTTPAVLRDCKGDVCGYYQYLQGTSMASPHAAGVAALIVSAYGRNDRAHPGTRTLAPSETERRLLASARDHACPEGGSYTYVRVLPTDVTTAPVTHVCEGTTARNGFYGEGIVNAVAAVTGRR
jgi:subtilisin family serine protease